jgi:hypothetical protein
MLHYPHFPQNSILFAQETPVSKEAKEKFKNVERSRKIIYICA